MREPSAHPPSEPAGRVSAEGKASAATAPPEAHGGFGTGAEVWLFRHGEVHEDFQGTAYGGRDVPLSAQGEADTREVARLFGAVPFRAVISSDLSRALAVGSQLAERCGAPLEVTPAMREISRGHWQGRTVAELHSEFSEEVAGFYGDPWNYDAHGGETDRDVWERAWPALERGVLEHGGPLALTAHFNVVRVLVARALGIAPHDSFRFRVDLGALCVLRDDPGGWRLLRANVRGLPR